MAIIKPTLTIVSNAADHSVTADQGPLSMALDLSTTVDITTVGVNSGRKTVSQAEGDLDTLFDGSTITGDSAAAGTHGSFLYLKNMTASGGTGDIMIGIEVDDSDLTDAADLSPTGSADRLFTLKPQEFAFFPYDHTMDITVDATADSIVLEWWKFDRTTTVSGYSAG